ncbi:MAG TPA: hypothetical protein VGJ28_14115 [Micromonosporaceae bacterium]|jgi:hypothetical protein
MFNHPEYVIAQARIHQQELLDEAEHHRLLKLAKQWRNACRPSSADRRAVLREADAIARTAPVAAAPVSALAGTLSTCGQHVAGSAR